MRAWKGSWQLLQRTWRYPSQRDTTISRARGRFAGTHLRPTSTQVPCVEKSVFSIWVDLLLCRSIQLLVLSYAEMFVYMYLSQLMSTFTELSKGASSSRWYLQSMTRRTSDSTITHMYLYTHVSQI